MLALLDKDMLLAGGGLPIHKAHIIASSVLAMLAEIGRWLTAQAGAHPNPVACQEATGAQLEVVELPNSLRGEIGRLSAWDSL